MTQHPVQKYLAKCSERDRQIAEELMEAGHTEENLYAALPNPKAVELLRKPAKPNRKDQA